jgi:hypothetical protein
MRRGKLDDADADAGAGAGVRRRDKEGRSSLARWIVVCFGQARVGAVGVGFELGKGGAW